MYIKRLILVMYERRKPMYNNVVSLTKKNCSRQNGNNPLEDSPRFNSRVHFPGV